MPGTDTFAQIPPNSTGPKVGAVSVTDSNGNVTILQKLVVTDPVTNDNIASVQATTPQGTEQGLVVRALLMSNLNSFVAASGKVDSPTSSASATSGAVNNLIYAFNPAASGKNVFLAHLYFNQRAGTAGTQIIQLFKITAEAGTPGGTSIAAKQKNLSSSTASVMAGHIIALPTGGPTLDSSNPLMAIDVPVTSNITAPIDLLEFVGSSLWQSPFELTPGTGIALQQVVDSAITTQPTFFTQWSWYEGS